MDAVKRQRATHDCGNSAVVSRLADLISENTEMLFTFSSVSLLLDGQIEMFTIQVSSNSSVGEPVVHTQTLLIQHVFGYLELERFKYAVVLKKA